MSQAQGLLLAHIENIGHLGYAPDNGEVLLFTLLLQGMLQLHAIVKMILDGPLVPPGNNQDILDSRRHGLFHHVLDGRLIDNGKHLFRLGLGGRQKAGAEAGSRDHCFLNFHLLNLLLIPSLILPLERKTCNPKKYYYNIKKGLPPLCVKHLVSAERLDLPLPTARSALDPCGPASFSGNPLQPYNQQRNSDKGHNAQGQGEMGTDLHRQQQDAQGGKKEGPQV